VVPAVFSKNRDRLLDSDIAQKFFVRVLEQAEGANLISDEHFSVDGTLIEAWASQKSFQRKDREEQPPKDDPGNPAVNFHGEKRSNDTHESATDPEARLARKSGGHESKLAYCGNVMIENRNGLVVDMELLQPGGTAERDAAMLMAERIEGIGRVTIAADKGYDTKDFVGVMRDLNVTPHVAQNDKRRGGSAIDGRTTRHDGYQVSLRKRKRIEEVFGWLKTVGMLRKTRHRGVFKVGWVFTFAAAAYNLVRMRTLLFPAVQSAQVRGEVCPNAEIQSVLATYPPQGYFRTSLISPKRRWTAKHDSPNYFFSSLLKRAYDAVASTDGTRFLVERL